MPNSRLDYAPVDSRVPRSWWRCVSSSYTPFAKESFVDELAYASGRDPLRFRMELLARESAETVRLRRVLQLAAEQSGWGKALPKRHGLGIACRWGQSCTAQVAEVFVDDEGVVHVLRIVGADYGIAVNPDGVSAMTEAAINFALTAVLTGEITIRGGAVKQGNFDDYRVLRINQAPDVDVHIVPSTEHRAASGNSARCSWLLQSRTPSSPPPACGSGDYLSIPRLSSRRELLWATDRKSAGAPRGRPSRHGVSAESR